MIQSDNNQSNANDQDIERDEFKKNSPIPEGYQNNQSNVKYHATENIQKNAVPHQRNELNPNQEQRPDRRNPQRNIDK